jgi:C4-dicarboxylate transporter DctM subunit
LRRPVEAVIAGVWPFIATNIIVLVLITYIPQISTAILKITR